MPGETGATPIPTDDLAAPARRALEGAGYETLEQLSEASQTEVGDLHGIGPSGLVTLREVLAAHDLSFSGVR